MNSPEINACSVSAPAPAYTLFSCHAVGLATFLGTPIAGSILMAVNYRRLGKGGAAAAAIGAGLVATALALAIGYLIPQGASIGVGFGLLWGARSAAKSLQGDDVEQHTLHGGKLGSFWVAAGLGLGVLAIVVAGYFAYFLAANPKVTIGNKDEIYYSGSASKEDAKALGDALKTSGFLTDRGVTVKLSKGQGGTVVSFVVKEGAWDNLQSVATFEEIGRQIAPSVGGFPIEVRLMNSDSELKKTVTVGRAIIGTKDEIYYFGSATEADAKAVGQALRTAGYLKDSGVSILLAKGDGTVISFVVKEGFWEEPQNVAAFETIVRGVAPTLGGLPIKLRLLNNALESKKETTVE